jgi:hypothetical protein
MAPIIFNGINVNSQNDNATIAIGKNREKNWGNTIKTNLGEAERAGINVVTETVSFIIDNDIVDAPYNRTEVEILKQCQKL